MNLYVVVVLYNCGIDESPTCATLLIQRASHGRTTVLVYDNSAVSKISSVPEGWQVVLDASNGGLSAAYNRAVDKAKAMQCEWILLLDQDTVLPDDFLEGIHQRLPKMRTWPSVVAIVPIVKAGNFQVSPMYPKLGREKAFRGRNVVVSEWLVAINSGACIRVDFVDEIGGFSKDFHLDYLDFWLFKMISNRHRSVYVGDVELQHELSVANMNDVSISRYRRVLAAELRYTNGYLPLLWRIIIVPRLVARAAKHFLYTRDKRIGLSMLIAAMSQVGFLCARRRPDSVTDAHG